MSAPTSSSRIASNVLFTGAGRAWSALLLFVTIPIIVHRIGTSAYGIFALISVILGYVAFLDFGITAAVVRSVAKYHALADEQQLGKTIGTALTLLTALGAAGALVIAALAPWIAHSVLHIQPKLEPDAVFAFRMGAIGFGCNMLLVVFAAIVQGLQRFDVFSTRTIFLSTFTSVAQIGAVLLGTGLRGVVIATVAVSVLSFFIFLAASRRLLPHVSFRPRFERSAVRELAGFGLFRFVTQASGQLTFQFDPVIIGIFQPIAAVGYYSVPLSVTQKFHVVQDSVASAYFPASVELHSRGDIERLHRLYLTSLKLVLVAMAFLIVIFGVFAHPVLLAWVGSDVADHSSGIFTLLALGYGLSALIGIPAQASDSTGHQRWTATFAAASAVIQLTLALVLVPRYGAIGAAAALVINTVTQGSVFVWLVQRRFLRIGAGTVFTQAVMRPLASVLGLLAIALLTLEFVHGTRTLLLAVALSGAAYAGLTFFLRVWTRSELQLANQLRRSVLRRRSA
ncbi:MAG TPA: flippase [Candidatus Dormibacteraeota bacterium]|nr:flippase [Candidatus Dormibacteraeota bacterium]